MAAQFEIGPETTFGELMKHKAESVGDQVFLTYIRDFDKDIEEKYTIVRRISGRTGSGTDSSGWGSKRATASRWSRSIPRSSSSASLERSRSALTRSS